MPKRHLLMLAIVATIPATICLSQKSTAPAAAKIRELENEKTRLELRLKEIDAELAALRGKYLIPLDEDTKVECKLGRLERLVEVNRFSVDTDEGVVRWVVVAKDNLPIGEITLKYHACFLHKDGRVLATRTLAQSSQRVSKGNTFAVEFSSLETLGKSLSVGRSRIADVASIEIRRK